VMLRNKLRRIAGQNPLQHHTGVRAMPQLPPQRS
jgi:hypothetical protein